MQLGTQFVAVQLGVNAVWHVVFVALLHVGGAVLDEVGTALATLVHIGTSAILV